VTGVLIFLVWDVLTHAWATVGTSHKVPRTGPFAIDHSVSSSKLTTKVPGRTKGKAPSNLGADIIRTVNRTVSCWSPGPILGQEGVGCQPSRPGRGAEGTAPWKTDAFPFLRHAARTRAAWLAGHIPAETERQVTVVDIEPGDALLGGSREAGQ
jgi:hypothetical protein